VPRRPCDAYEAARAALMQQMSPGWVVMWGPWTRKFTAWHAADPTQTRCVESADPEELRDLITTTETLAGLTFPHRQPTSANPLAGEARQAQPRGHETNRPASQPAGIARGGRHLSRGRGLHRPIPRGKEQR